MSEEKELVWLPKEIAIQVKGLENGEQLRSLILKYIEDSKRDIQITIEAFDDDLIQYQAQMIRFRNKFEEAKNAELKANYEMWEKFDIEKGKIKSKVGDFLTELKPLKEDIKLVEAFTNSISSHRIDQLVESIRSLSLLLQDKRTLDVLKLLIEKKAI